VLSKGVKTKIAVFLTPPAVGHVWLSYFRLQLWKWVTSDMPLSSSSTCMVPK